MLTRVVRVNSGIPFVKSLFLFFSYGFDFGVLLESLSVSLLGYTYNVRPLKFSIVCLFSYFLIRKTRLEFIRRIISLAGSKIHEMNTYLSIEISSSSVVNFKASCKLAAAQYLTSNSLSSENLR